MAMASLNASLLAPKGCAQPAARAPALLPPSDMLPPSDTRYSAIGHIAPANRKAPPKTRESDGVPEKKTKKKSLRLSASTDKYLRLLAVRNGVSQQVLLELAVVEYLDQAFAAGDCICRR